MDKTLIKGLNVLEALVGSERPRGAAELAAELGLGWAAPSARHPKLVCCSCCWPGTTGWTTPSRRRIPGAGANTCSTATRMTTACRSVLVAWTYTHPFRI